MNDSYGPSSTSVEKRTSIVEPHRSELPKSSHGGRSGPTPSERVAMVHALLSHIWKAMLFTKACSGSEHEAHLAEDFPIWAIQSH